VGLYFFLLGGSRSITKYVRAARQSLASASEEDRVEFAADIVSNIKRLIRIADRLRKPPRYCLE